MVHKVICGEPELDLFAFAHLKILEERKVARPVPGPKELRQHDRPVLTGHCGDRETVAVQELMRSDVLSGVASQIRHQGDLVGTVDRLCGNCVPGRRFQRAGYAADVEITSPTVGVGCQVDPALH